ncbi:hypothetical protein, partial [Escherichia coli]|uniref:hypothetical protein n=1 Tax=Escherichia coli TaxID=562 RepID=UPI001C58B3E5
LFYVISMLLEKVYILENQEKDQKPSSPPKPEEDKNPSTIQEVTSKPEPGIEGSASNHFNFNVLILCRCDYFKLCFMSFPYI